MIKELSDALKALIESLSAKPLATIIGIFIIFSAYLAYRSYDRLEAVIVTPGEEAARFEKQLTNSEIINEAIEKLRVDLGADSVVIRQFHNGKHDLTGIPFTGIATTYYVDPLDMDGHDIITDEPVSSSNKSLRRVWQRIDKPECVIISSPVDISTRKYFKTHNLSKMAICPLVNLLNYPIGMMVIGFSEGNTTSDEVIIQRTSAIAKRVTGYLINGY